MGYLELDEMQCQIATADPLRAIDLLCQQGICPGAAPTGSLELGRVSCVPAYTIGLLLDAGVTVTPAPGGCLLL